jgi:RimJ/RimL family protein N-acetyltransferase
MEVELKTFNKRFLKLSWKWLNDPEIRFLTNTPDFTKEQQLQWFNSLKDRKDYLVWGVEADSTPIGVCGLKNIAINDCEYWAYIGDKLYWGKGLGKVIMSLIEAEARKFGKSSVWLRVLKDNPRAISLYTKKGYVTESETDSLILMRKKL